MAKLPTPAFLAMDQDFCPEGSLVAGGDVLVRIAWELCRHGTTSIRKNHCGKTS
ncbi:hypothetical protein [Microbispora sp. GKU 823]|uniref:hypothetical protein n=1 Tax=Microbispora sp. GKU 823 TaxID=1652100 RepID=UPI0015C4C1FF|nr:hypothetical protein [Microbispora sp. GKU 823]